MRGAKGRTLTGSCRLARLRGLIPGLLLILTCLTPAAAYAQNQTANPGRPSPMPLFDDEGRVTRDDIPPTLTNKQKKGIMHSNFEKSKRDAAELAALAKQLREELNKPDVSTLSLEGMNRIERIEKLAKKIRDEMKGY
ncbi:MAG TPA: hypothetical protein VEN79_18705 [Terriglobia bacterium]|nr:hypothetical protein [Terriglobia bacterium]